MGSSSHGPKWGGEQFHHLQSRVPRLSLEILTFSQKNNKIKQMKI